VKIRRRKRPFRIPTDSMSDVAFLLLIFIMLVSLINYRLEVKIDYALAQSPKKTSADENREIWIDGEGGLYLDGVPADIWAVQERVEALNSSAPDTRIHVIADRNTPFMFVHQVVEAMQAAQYRVVSFVVKDGS
jgi:biopolymer transport protein ExbD